MKYFSFYHVRIGAQSRSYAVKFLIQYTATHSDRERATTAHIQSIWACKAYRDDVGFNPDCITSQRRNILFSIYVRYLSNLGTRGQYIVCKCNNIDVEKKSILRTLTMFRSRYGSRKTRLSIRTVRGKKDNKQAEKIKPYDFVISTKLVHDIATNLETKRLMIHLSLWFARLWVTQGVSKFWIERCWKAKAYLMAYSFM